MSVILSDSKIEKITNYVNSFSQSDFGSSEANTKKKIIEPMLKTLGWDLEGNEVRLEYKISIGTSSNYVDYAIFLEGKPLILLEAKSFDSSLSTDYSSQIISYGRVDGIRWVVLTNGKTVKIFDTEAGKSEKECIVSEISLQDLPKGSAELSLISRASILTGEIESAAKRLATTKKAVTALILKKEEIAQEFEKILLKITGQGIENRIKTISTRLADLAVQLFENETEPTTIQRVDKADQIVSQNELVSKPPGDVVLCSSKFEGVEFLKKYNAWGFVKINRQVPYFALYVGSPESAVLYFGEVESITQPITSKADIQSIEENDLDNQDYSGKRVIHLKQGTLVKLRNPIPLKDKKLAPRGPMYTTLEKLIHANHTEELYKSR